MLIKFGPTAMADAALAALKGENPMIPGKMTDDEKALANTLHAILYSAIEQGVVTSDAALGCIISVTAAVMHTQWPEPEVRAAVHTEFEKELRRAAKGFAIYAEKRRTGAWRGPTKK